MTTFEDALVGHVRVVHSYPVKSMDAPQVRSVYLDVDGVRGDRRFAVQAGERVLGAQDVPDLRDVTAWLGPDGDVELDIPGMGRRLRGPGADAALSLVAGRSVRLVPVDVGSQVQAPVHLVSQQSIEAAADPATAGAHDHVDHGDLPCPCSTTEVRANLVLDLHVDGGPREDSWLGRRVRIGASMLRITRRPGHCLGVYADVLVPAEVQAGDAILLVAPSGAPATIEVTDPRGPITSA